jgi:uncharacterized membrane protein
MKPAPPAKGNVRRRSKFLLRAGSRINPSAPKQAGLVGDACGLCYIGSGMATFDDLPAAPVPQPATAAGRFLRAARMVLARPVAAFVFLSMLFGTPTIVLTPPLEGPDEPAHFLRAYGISLGEIVPTMADEHGRKGILVPARLHRGYAVFEHALFKLGKTKDFDYRNVWAEYSRIAADPDTGRPPVFQLYWGSEGYAPVAYLPQAGAAVLARMADLDFVATLLLMRFAGLAAMTAVTAYAIALAGRLGWTFLLIAMLPAALYGRSMVSADGAALACTMVITALCVRAARSGESRRWERALFMTLCVLSKPPQLAFVLLEAMTRPFRQWPRHWRTLALVVLPGLILAPLWVVAVSGDAGTWRLFQNTAMPPEHFSIAWKLRFMLEHPLHFPLAVITGLRWSRHYWLQLIGILGWLDTWLQLWVYPVVTLALVAVCLVPIELERSTRLRIALVSGLTVFVYWLAIYLIFFMIWTPIASIEVEGVQGRYFLPVLPALALVVSALIRRGPAPTTTAAVALAGAIVSGGAVVEAIWRMVGPPFGW